MNVIAHFILILLTKAAIGQYCVIDQPTVNKWEKQLRTDIVHSSCNNADVPPMGKQNNTLTVVKIRFKLRYFTLGDDGLLVMHLWLFLSWNDERLKWDPEKYGGITKTQVSDQLIWSPNVDILNGLDSTFDVYYSENCDIMNTGDVSCTHRSYSESPCNIKSSDFPYDAQECSLEFGIGSVNNSFKMNFSSRAISMFGADYGSQWFISDYQQRSEKNKPLIMTFVFEREAESVAAVIVYPSIIVSCLTVTCLFLDVRNKLRLAIACFTIYTHYYWLLILRENIPFAFPDAPRLLLYYRGSMILAVLVLMLTFVLSAMCRRSTTPSHIVVSVNNFVLSSYSKYIIYPRWEVNDNRNSDGNEFNANWTNLANIINTFSKFVVITVYFAMYFAFIPKPIPIKY